MFRVKQSRNGYVLVYTLIILSLLFSVTILSFKIELMRKKYNDLSIETQILDNKFQKERSYLLSKTSNEIQNILGSKELSKDEIHNALIELNKLYFNSSFMEYNKNSKKIVLNIVTIEGIKKVEYYNYVIESESNKIKFITTVP